jgi:hypothetical protein
MVATVREKEVSRATVGSHTYKHVPTIEHKNYVLKRGRLANSSTVTVSTTIIGPSRNTKTWRVVLVR